MTRKLPDLLALAIVLALSAGFAAWLVDFNIPPFEDAAMLMRYAEHLADGHGIVWNVGEPPLDGATDFLFMVAVAGFCRLGLAVETAVRCLTIGSHFATIVLVYAGMRRVQRAGVGPAAVSALYFAVGPGLFLAAAYFGTPFFVLGVAVAWLLAQRLGALESRTVRSYATFSIACLLMGLIRPEGVLISVFMLAAVGVRIRPRQFGRLAATFGAIFLVLGGAYFLWRWHYFGHPLPNPFYKKGGGTLHFDGLERSYDYSLAFALPFIPMFVLALRSLKSLRMAVASLIPIVGATCMWVLLSSEMNFGGRFQYPLLVLYVLSWYPLVRSLPERLGLPRLLAGRMAAKAGLAVVVVAALIPVFHRQIASSRRITYCQDGRYDVGRMLSRYADRGYTLATTEAGLLPLYSRWRAIDTWGLNDRWIARHGGITQEYLARQAPDVILWHEYFSPQHPQSGMHFGQAWFEQVMTLKQYAERNHFTLAAVFGTRPDDTHYYYVRPGLPDHDAIVAAIRATPYHWHFNGTLCVDYAGPAESDDSQRDGDR